MSNPLSRRLKTAVLVAITCVVATQASAVVIASAAPSSPDGGPSAAPANTDRSQTPLQVRNHTAKLVAPMAATQHLRVSIGVKPRDPAAQEQFLAAVQDRRSPLFHKYLTAAQWNARFAPSAADEAAVVGWAHSAGLTVTHRYPNRLLVDVDATAAALQSALHVKLNTYSLGGKSFYANDRDPVLPSALSSVVTSVDGLNNAASLTTSAPSKSLAPTKAYAAGPVVQAGPGSRTNGSRTALQAAMAKDAGATPSITGGSYDPTDIYSSQAYDETALRNHSSCCNPNHVAGSSPPETSIAITSVGQQAVSDMQGFQARYSYLAYNFNEIFIDGTPACCDGEGTMDLEWSTALSNSFGSFADTAHVWMYDGVNAQISTFNDMFNQILTDGHAKIVSSSWGCAEVFCYSDSSMNTNHNIFNAMIGQGYTLVNASDDKGAFADCSHVSVQYPASDSDFLAISATNLELNSSSQYVSETAWPANSAGCAGNGGGGGGGCSVKFTAPGYQLSPSNPNYFCASNGTNFKTVPDVSLNGDWSNSPQNLFFNGGWQGNGGTSISAPEFAGYFAQQNAYLLTLGNICGLGSGNAPCAPIGQAGSNMYRAALSHAAGRNPYYDITSGCTSNDVGSGFCGITGYDRATGWGTVNMLQLAWSMNYWTVAEATAPTVGISGPATNTWLNGGTLSWNVADSGGSFPAAGVAGWTARWDVDPGNPLSHATPGSGDSFYSGPASVHGSTSGSLSLASAGQGCHTLFVRAWDNIGLSGVSSYGPVCYDGTAPVTTAPQLNFVKNAQVTTANKSPVRISWSGSDNLSGIGGYSLFQSVDGGGFTAVSLGSPTAKSVMLNLAPNHTYQYAVAAQDNAGNFGSFAFSSVSTLSLYQESSSAVSYSGTWTTQNSAVASGGKWRFSTHAGDTATFTFQGRKVAWVAVRDTNRGNARVTLDGVVTGVDTNASTFEPRAESYVGSAGGGTHTLVIKNLGTAGHPRINVDAFFVLS
jgi:subtilase family serine protease